MRELIQEEITDMDGINCYITKGVLIRCKDCKYWWKDAEPYSISICNRSELCMGENDYCSLAERKEE